MPGQTTQPELIITLSRDKVDVRLLAIPDKRPTTWQQSFSIAGNFASDQVSNALDKALMSNPDLLDHFPCVHVLIMDRPSVNIPSYILGNGNGSKVILRHLRARIGDQLNVDLTNTNNAICYSIPDNTMAVLHEYYHTIGKVHMISLLSNAIREHHQHPGEGMYVVSIANSLFVFASQDGKFNFAKTFEVRHQADLQYYIVACKRLLKPGLLHWIVIQDEIPAYAEPNESYLKFDHRLHLPSISTLLTQYNPCAS